jgi:hypothetical protein
VNAFKIETERAIMSRLLKFAVALSVSSVAAVGLQAAPAHASTTAGQQSAIVGELGVDVGPGAFEPTAGTVEVEFDSHPLVLEKHVGKSGNFHIKLSPGSYTVIGCGPKKSGNQCSQPQNITLAPGEVDHLQLIWASLP